jgi:hypothetical protein
MPSSDIPMPPFPARLFVDGNQNALTKFALLDLDLFLLAVRGLTSSTIGHGNLCFDQDQQKLAEMATYADFVSPTRYTASDIVVIVCQRRP